MSTCCQTGTCAICTSPEAIAARAETERLVAAARRFRTSKAESEAEQVERVMRLGKRGLLPGGQHEIRVRGGAR